MLDTLNEFNQKEALGVLSKLASQIAPEPLIEEERTAPEAVDFQYEDVLSEIRNRLGLASSDNSDEARDKVISFISDQISQIVLGGADEKAILTRLGDKGILRPDLYEVTFSPFFERAEERGIRRKHVLTLFNYPDDVEHLEFRGREFKDQGSFSLYVKHHVDKEPKQSFSLLVVSNRKGFQQTVMDAMRVYPTDVDVANVHHPIDLLKAFVEKYGEPVTILNRREKFFLFATIEKPRIIYEQPLFTFEKPEGTDLQSLILFADTGKTVEVAMSYAINRTAYHFDLKKHGIQVS